jgi:hypothetical protein
MNHRRVWKAASLTIKLPLPNSRLFARAAHNRIQRNIASRARGLVDFRQVQQVQQVQQVHRQLGARPRGVARLPFIRKWRALGNIINRKRREAAGRPAPRPSMKPTPRAVVPYSGADSGTATPSSGARRRSAPQAPADERRRPVDKSRGLLSGSILSAAAPPPRARAGIHHHLDPPLNRRPSS